METVKGAAALLLTAAPAFAGGIERAPQSIAILFEKENYVEFSAGRASPKVSGRDLPLYSGGQIVYPGGRETGDIGHNYNFFGVSLKYQFNDRLSGALIVEQPFGADIEYRGVDAASNEGSVNFGGSSYKVDSTTYTGLLRYKLEDGFAIHGGVRASQASASMKLRGYAYGPLNGYQVDFDKSWGAGYVLGASWEKPEIGARVSLTYNSPIDHDFDTTEIGPMPALNGTDTVTIKTPRSWTLEGRTGIAPDTAIYGSVRWVNWSEFRFSPKRLDSVSPGEAPDDSTTWVIGVSRKFNPTWSGSAHFTYEKAPDRLVSPFAGYAGRKGLTVAAIYNKDKWKITTSAYYFKLGDAKPETGTPDVARATMSDSRAVGVALRVGYSF